LERLTGAAEHLNTIGEITIEPMGEQRLDNWLVSSTTTRSWAPRVGGVVTRSGRPLRPGSDLVVAFGSSST
jgi:hypothetical protein